MNQKFQQKICHVNVNVNLMEEIVIQIKSGIAINVDASVKNIIYVKKIIYENENYLASIIDDSLIICDLIIEETKTFSTNFN